MIKKTDLAYAAGYIDGDGCFYIDKIFIENHFKYRCFMIINSTEIENLHWFQKNFGGTLTSKPSIKHGHKPMNRLVIKGRNLDNLKNIKPFLIEKFNEFQIFEEFRNTQNKEIKNDLIQKMEILKHKTNLIKISIKNDVESIRRNITPTIEDFAYLSGFIDSECCLNISKSKPKNKPNATYKTLLQCNNTKSPFFYWVSARFGGQFHFIDRSKYGNNRNQMCWRLSSNSLFQILDKIRPFLIHKKPVCEELIKFCKTIVPLENTISRNSLKFKDFYQPILQERERIFHKIQALNKKGC